MFRNIVVVFFGLKNIRLDTKFMILHCTDCIKLLRCSVYENVSSTAPGNSHLGFFILSKYIGLIFSESYSLNSLNTKKHRILHQDYVQSLFVIYFITFCDESVAILDFSCLVIKYLSNSFRNIFVEFLDLKNIHFDTKIMNLNKQNQRYHIFQFSRCRVSGHLGFCMFSH